MLCPWHTVSQAAYLSVCSVTTFIRLEDARCCAYGDCDRSSNTCGQDGLVVVCHLMDNAAQQPACVRMSAGHNRRLAAHLAVADILCGQGEDSQVLLRLRALRRILHGAGSDWSARSEGTGPGAGISSSPAAEPTQHICGGHELGGA